MANIITAQILREINTGETVVDKDADKLYKWIGPGTIHEAYAYGTGDKLVANTVIKAAGPVGWETGLNSLPWATGMETGIVVAPTYDITAIQVASVGNGLGISNPQALPKLASFPTDVDGKDILLMQGVSFANNTAANIVNAYVRNFHTIINGVESNTFTEAEVLVSDVEDIATTISTSVEKFAFLSNLNTLITNKYKGNVGAGDEVPAGTLFRIKPTGHGFADITTTSLGSISLDNRAGWYYTVGASVTLDAGAFNDAAKYGATFFAVNPSSDYSSDDLRGGMIPAASADAMVTEADGLVTVSTDGPVIHVTAGPPEDLINPTESNVYWTEVPWFVMPIDGSQNLTADATANLPSSATKTFANPWSFHSQVNHPLLSSAEFWEKISDGLEADIAATNATVWSEIDLPETDEALIYRP